jgi:phosphate starvation-inducible membrane PsiE
MYNGTMMKKDVLFYIKWFATFATIIGALLTSFKMDPYNIIFFNIGALSWLIVAIKWKEYALILINSVLLLIYFIGLFVA